jgi:hypothetical protein
MTRLVLPLLCLLLAAPASAAAEPLREARTAHAQLIWNRDVLAGIGVAVSPAGARRAKLDSQYRALELELAGRLSFTLEKGHFVRVIDGALALPRPFTLRAGKRATTLALRLRAANRGTVAFELADPRGDAWFTVHYVHQFTARDALEMGNLDVRAAPRLAEWLGRRAVAGLAVGAMHLELPFSGAAKALDAASSCAAPNWPGTPGYSTDVLLTDVRDLQAQCALDDTVPYCDGSGSSPNALIKLTPETVLYNLGTGDVPWYKAFSSVTPPGAYPYASIDQHPVLVWNVYRVNGVGQLEQIARSGAKHAFATANEGCDCADFRILGPACADTYGSFTNNLSQALAPRREVIAARGIWGRCHSLFDPDCDGVENTGHDVGDFEQRAVVHESDLAPDANPGATYYVDAWYVIRDDENLYDTMGWRTFAPSFVDGAWELAAGPTYTNGAVIDAWVGAPSPTQRNTEVVTARGRAKLAVKVVALGGNAYRYDYALMNFDFGVAVTAGAEPNLDVQRNRGFSALTIPVPAGTFVSAASFFDGDRNAADDWTATIGAGMVRWTAPANTSLDWGSLYRFSMIAYAAPQAANATIAVAESGVIADPLALTIGPGIGDTIFADGWE